MSRFYPIIQPMLLQRRREPFDHADWLFELKYDGFRALAYIDQSGCRLVSRNGNTFSSFTELAAVLPADIKVTRAVLDGEIVCLDGDGKPQFYNLLYRRARPCFAAFDVLFIGDRDLRDLTLVERKAQLRTLLKWKMARVLYVDHVEGSGVELFRLACERDLEGIVAKHKHAPYVSDRKRSTWVKIKNPRYTQAVRRDEHFQRLERGHERQSEPAEPIVAEVARRFG